MAKFKVGDKVEVDLDSRLNKYTESSSTKILLEYLKTHVNVLTVSRVRNFGLSGDLVYFEECADGFDPARFSLIEGPTFNINALDLEGLLNE